MKNRILLLLIAFNLAVLPGLFAQNVSINSTGNLPDSSAMLDISSTTKGFLLPRMTTAQQNAIILPAKGLAVFNTTLNSYQVNTGTPLSPVWSSLTTAQSVIDTTNIAGFSPKVRSVLSAGPGIDYSAAGVIGNAGVLSINGNTGPLTMDTGYIADFSQKVRSLTRSTAPITYSNGNIGITQANASTDGYLSSEDWNTFNSKANAANSWNLTGNDVTSAQAIGTTSNFDFPFITHNMERMRLSAGGNLGIGTTVTDGINAEKLLVDAGTTSYNIISGKGNNTGYLQLNIKNLNPGASASSDVVATSDLGTEANGINYVDMGINSSGNTTTGILGGASTGYLYSTGSDFSVGNATSGKNLLLFTGGIASSNERMRIDGNGNVGIGVTSPQYKLHVAAASNPLYLGGVQTGSNTDSLLMIFNGVVKKLSPSALTTSSGNAWGLTGNSSTNPASNFIGTTDGQPLIFKVSNQPSGRIDLVNTFLGYQAGYSNNASTQNTGVGYHALHSNSSGTYNTAIGYNSLPNNGTGSHNIGVGYNADVAGNNSNSIAMGSNTYVSNSNGIAVGTSAQVANSYGMAIGSNTYVSGSNGTAVGNSAQAASSYALAIGSSTYVSGSNGIALGTSAQAASSYALAIGSNTYVSGLNGIAIGSGPGSPKTQAQGTSSIALGYNSYTSGTNSIAIGTGTTSGATNTVVIGNGASAYQSNSIILGDASNNSVNVGLGTASPSAKLHIIATSGNNPLLLQGLPTGAASDNLLTINPGTGVVNSIAYSSFSNSWNLNGNHVSSIQKFGTTSNYDLPFITNNTERMRIDGNGNVGIGTTSPDSRLDVSGTYKLGSSGTVLNNMIKTTVTIGDAATFSHGQTKTYTATVTGATVNATVIVNPRSALPAGVSIAWSRISSSNVVTIAFTNSDTSAKAVGSNTYDVTVIQ